MQKIKQNAKPVGAGFHTRLIEEMTQNKGITLIALIITIIVMLILVGVTINVSLNGGLFTKASEASKQMQVEADRETLLSAVVAAIGYDGKVDLGEIELPTGWTGSNGTYTSPKGNTYTVDENGKITEGESKEENVEKDEPIQHTLTLAQVAKGAYTDMAVIEFVELEIDEQQKNEIIEKSLQLEFNNNKSIEENILEWFNEATDSNYASIEETGYTVDILLNEFIGEAHDDTAVKMFYSYATYSIIRPDGTKYEQVGTKSYTSNAGECVYNRNSINTYGWIDECYLAPQLGTYKITATLGNHVATGTITINEF